MKLFGVRSLFASTRLRPPRPHGRLGAVTINVFPCPGPHDAGTVRAFAGWKPSASALDASLSPLVGNAGRLWAGVRDLLELAGRTIGSEPQQEVR